MQMSTILTLKAPIMTAADDINIFYCFSEKIRLDISSESSARQRFHMKNQALFPLKDKSKKLKCCLLQFLFGALKQLQTSGYRMSPLAEKDKSQSKCVLKMMLMRDNLSQTGENQCNQIHFLRNT